MNSRRTWLKQTSAALAGITVLPFQSFSRSNQAEGALFEDKKLIILRSNENPYGPSALAKKAMLQSITTSNRYNWELSTKLATFIANQHQLSADYIMMGAGSAELLELVARYSALKQGNFIIADPTFDYWVIAAEESGLKRISIPLTASKEHDLNAMYNAIQADTRLIYICNPNNPTGTICERKALEDFIQAASKKALILVDEAYLDYSDESSLSSLVKTNKNLVITGTFSKIHGLAGARIGYAIAHPDTINNLSRLQAWPSGTVNVISAAGALASYQDHSFKQETKALNQKARTYTISELEKRNIHCIPSHSNFIYFSLKDYKKDYFDQLNQHQIQGTKIYEEKGQWSRITIGTMHEMEQFIQALD